MIIKNGLVIDPASGLSEKMDLLIEDGIIKEMASLITKEGEEVLDAAGLVVAQIEILLFGKTLYY